MTIMKLSSIAALSLLLAAASHASLDSGKAKRHYVGSDACAICHAADSIGNQYDLWLRTPHAKAVDLLRTKAAIPIAEKLSIKKPAEEPRCLSCHATGGGKYPDITSEGVGCEACHGPGSDYQEYDNHADTVNRQGGFEKGIKNGMNQILGIKNIKKREKMCLKCHNSGRLCYPATNKEIYRQSISLQVIADMKKEGDPKKGEYVNLKHSLIPPFPQY